ncbi:MAG: squalene/phytoene synthase family protein [Gemmatimonadetes bacterium]|nr:MAG: squalene/phytoene synthase family protein [Gemmatimonadota bacterium]
MNAPSDASGTVPPPSDVRALQAPLLQGVSRTFALTIPVLPGRLRDVVGNAYLLCRIVDTIEDEPAVPLDAKRELSALFVDAVAGRAAPEAFRDGLSPHLSERTLPAERELVARSAEVLSVTHGLQAEERAAIERCVRIMAEGMVHYQEQAPESFGLADLADLDRYCYHVAGVVGEMLTELFAHAIPEVAAERPRMLRLGRSFGQGLQMTNILKDLWDDRARGACWLPRSVFAEEGFDLDRLRDGDVDDAFARGLERLVGIAHGHLRNALTYTLAIPAREPGVRNFCLWALGMAVLTLRRIHARPGFRSGAEVKISRRQVKATVALSRLFARRDGALRALFRAAARSLPPPPEGVLIA